MATAASAQPARPLPAAATADVEDSSASSPLSEVDYNDGNDADIEHMQLDARRLAGDDSGEEKRGANAQDSDSALSDAASDVNSEVNDTEAETERLYDTPKNQRHREVLIDEFNNGRIIEHTPTKLRRTTRLDGATNGNTHDANLATDDDVSVLSSRGEGNESPAKPATTNDSSVDGDAKPGFLQERKRKRPSPTDSPLSDQPLSKRSAMAATEHIASNQDVPMKDEEITSADPLSGHQSGRGEEEDEEAEIEAEAEAVAGEEDEDEAEEEEQEEQQQQQQRSTIHGMTKDVSERETRSNKRSARLSTRRKGPAGDDAVEEADSDTRDEAADADMAVEDEAEQREEEADADGEEEAELMARNLEQERKEAAFKDWTHIEEMFGFFRQRLYKDRLERLEEEERSLAGDEPTHAEYLSMKKCIDDRLNKRLEEIDREHEFRIKAHERKAVAVHAQIWSQFFQGVRERREQALERLNRQWYQVQGARRSAHSLPDYGLLFPKDPAQRVRNAVAYNMEVSALAGLAKYEGFPAGPELRGSSSAEIEGDLAAVEHARRNATRQRNMGHHRHHHHHHHHHHHQRDDYHAPNFGRLGPAGEQFIKDTPWANPNHSAHKQQQQQQQQQHTSTSSESGLSASASQRVLGLQTIDGRPVLDGQALDK